MTLDGRTGPILVGASLPRDLSRERGDLSRPDPFCVVYRELCMTCATQMDDCPLCRTTIQERVLEDPPSPS